MKILCVSDHPFKKNDEANEFFMCISDACVQYILELLVDKAGL